ncbi:opioid growth factor receptor-like protein 1 [Neoarius graeffei]|uniref:opioid growth factor receptor-like protein 1 n=1 Tax=Neoarius graeffei TaxID=443677 RepID=UPI00298D3463|nr:opioid growth factor receptor-like protein 1 [Neoarius graeffei]
MGCEGSVMEDPDNEYDSTWDDECEDQKFRMMRAPKQQTWTAQRNLEAARQMQIFRHGYRLSNCANQSHGQGNQRLHNLHFYQNQTPFQPDGVYIEAFHNLWFGDYTRLERVHSYIQWLFPTQEPGVNYHAHVLTITEIKHFREDKKVKKRLLKSYKLMLDFYGIQLVSELTGEVQRSRNWKERFENLNRNAHNNLRITRILKCLGLLGFCHFQAPLVHFFLTETLVNGTLQQVKQSVLDYFVFTVVDKAERKKLIRYAFWNFEPKQQFVWCPRRIQRTFVKRLPKTKHPLQILADAGMHNQPAHSRGLEVPLSSKNSAKNKRVGNAGHKKIEPRNSRPSAQSYSYRRPKQARIVRKNLSI